MQIAIEIRHSFGDVAAFAAFASKLNNLFAEYAPVTTVRSAAPAIANVDGPGAVPPRALPDRKAAEPTVVDRADATQSNSVGAVLDRSTTVPNSDTVTAAPSASGSASPLADVPVSEANTEETKSKRGRKPGSTKSKETPETTAPASLPAAGSFGGPAVVSPPPATAPTPAASIPSHAAGASRSAEVSSISSLKADTSSLEADKAYCMEWIGNNANGHARYMELIADFVDEAAGIKRLQDFTAENRAKLVARLKANDDRK
jgi:hypothetical protein